MNKMFFFLLIGWLGTVETANAQMTPGQVKLHGVLKHFNNAADLNDFSELEYLVPRSTSRMITPDSTGAFTLSVPLTAPGYFRLGRNVLYLSPGDDLEVVIDYMNSETGSFTGRGSAANMYLRGTLYPKAGSFLNAGQLLKKRDPAEALDAIQAAAASRKKELDELSNVSDEFKRLEYARIKGDVICSFHAVASYESYMNRNQDSAKAFIASFEKMAAPVLAENNKDFLDASLLKVEVYRDIADELPGVKGSSAQAGVIRDWLKASELVRQMQQTNDKKDLRHFKVRIDSIGTPLYKNALDRSLDSLLAFGKGDKAVDFVATDKDGRKIPLSSLKGKVIFVDIWATWCGPCMAEMPHYEELKAKYKGNPSVAFVSLSIDDDKGLWQKSIVKRKAEGYQWLINRNNLSAYNIVGIPRTLLINKDFRIVELNGEMPSDPAAAKSINGLL
jgi:thiol-disulfide isomerase/thioredoxin